MTRSRVPWLALAALLGVAVGIMDRPPDGTRRPPDLGEGGTGIPGEPNVVELPAPWVRGGCGNGCWNAYLELAANRPSRSRAPADGRRAAPPAAAGLPGEELRRRIVDGLAIDGLLVGLRERALAVAVLGESRSPAGVSWRKLLFWDPAVGLFDGLLLLPAGDGPHPAVIGLHGHRHNGKIFAEEYLGARLAREGIAVLVPRFRAHDCLVTESLVARALRARGLTLMGFRVYEVLLMRKYLEHLDAVDGRRVGLLSHSGGSSVANLVVRVADGFRAHVADYRVGYLDTCGPLEVHCETIPALAPLAAEVNDFTTLELPHLLVPYKFPDPELRSEIVAFFRRHLAAGGSPGTQG